MSQSGLAILLSVTRQAIDYLADTVSNETAPDFFKPLFGKPLHLVTVSKSFLILIYLQNFLRLLLNGMLLNHLVLAKTNKKQSKMTLQLDCFS